MDISSLETNDIDLKIEALIKPLFEQERLSSVDVLNQVDKIEEFIPKVASQLEVEGNFGAVIRLYEQVVNALRQAALKVPVEDKDLIDSIGKFWFSTLQARCSASRLRPLEPMVPSSPTTIIESPKLPEMQETVFLKSDGEKNKMVTSPVIYWNISDMVGSPQISKAKRAEERSFYREINNAKSMRRGF